MPEETFTHELEADLSDWSEDDLVTEAWGKLYEEKGWKPDDENAPDWFHSKISRNEKGAVIVITWDTEDCPVNKKGTFHQQS